MKRVLLCVIAAMAVIAVTPFAAGANHSDGTGPKFQKANGTGYSSQYGQVHVNADNNDDDLGHFFIGEDGSPKIQGDVTCFEVDGNTALIGGVQRGTGLEFLIEVTDDGEPGHEGDEHRWRPALPGEAQDCDEFGDNPPPAPIERGNYIVHGG